MQFPAGLFARELPVDGGAVAVDAALPSMNFAAQCRQVTDSALSQTLAAESIGDIVERAVEFTGMRSVPVEDKTKLLTDNGPGYVARMREDYLRLQSIAHIRCSPHHPQTNGKLERFHQTLKARLNVLVYTRAEVLRWAMAEFIEYYNQRRYHEGIGNVAPADVYYGRREEILRRRKEQKELTIQARLRYNLGRREPQPEGGSKLKTIAAASGSGVSKVLKTNRSAPAVPC